MAEKQIHVPRGKIMLFGGSAHLELAREISDFIKVPLGQVELSSFANGELYVRFLESVRGTDIFIVQTITAPVNRNLMELLIMVDALRRASAERISAVIPHFAYARQDKKVAAREPITAKLVANLLVTAGVNRVITMDLHAGQIQGFFDVPVDHLTAIPLMADYFRKKSIKDLTVCSPDVGRVKAVKQLADLLHAPLAIIHKSRPGHNVAEVANVVGEVKGKNVILADDMIDTGGTIARAAEALKAYGAKRVYACATHHLFSDSAVQKLSSAPLEEIIVTNTLPLTGKKQFDKVKVISVAKLLGQAIVNVHADESVSQLFKGIEHA